MRFDSHNYRSVITVAATSQLPFSTCTLQWAASFQPSPDVLTPQALSLSLPLKLRPPLLPSPIPFVLHVIPLFPSISRFSLKPQPRYHSEQFPKNPVFNYYY